MTFQPTMTWMARLILFSFNVHTDFDRLVFSQNGSPLLTCALFQYCHDASDATNYGGQTQPDGKVDYIADSNGWCKAWAPQSLYMVLIILVWECTWSLLIEARTIVCLGGKHAMRFLVSETCARHWQQKKWSNDGHPPVSEMVITSLLLSKDWLRNLSEVICATLPLRANIFAQSSTHEHEWYFLRVCNYVVRSWYI